MDEKMLKEKLSKIIENRMNENVKRVIEIEEELSNLNLTANDILKIQNLCKEYSGCFYYLLGFQKQEFVNLLKEAPLKYITHNQDMFIDVMKNIIGDKDLDSFTNFINVQNVDVINLFENSVDDFFFIFQHCVNSGALNIAQYLINLDTENRFKSFYEDENNDGKYVIQTKMTYYSLLNKKDL